MRLSCFKKCHKNNKVIFNGLTFFGLIWEFDIHETQLVFGTKRSFVLNITKCYNLLLFVVKFVFSKNKNTFVSN